MGLYHKTMNLSTVSIKLKLLLLQLNSILPLQLFAKSVFQVKYDVCEEVEMMRQDRQEGRN